MERIQIERDDRIAPAGDELLDQSVTDLASGARDEHHRFPHQPLLPFEVPRFSCSIVCVGESRLQIPVVQAEWLYDVFSERLASRLAIRGRALEVEWWGPAAATAPPLVLLHEGLGSVGLWKDLPAVLAERTGRQVFAYSRFGHGASDPPATPHSTQFMHEEAELLPEILDAAALDRVILLGHSDGGSIAHPRGGTVSRARSPASSSKRRMCSSKTLALPASITCARGTRESDLRERLAKHHAHVDVAFSGWCDVWLDPAFRRWNLEVDLPRVVCPTLVIQGVLDRYGTLAQVDAIARQVSGPVARLVLAECGHTPHRDQRDRVLEAIGTFVGGIT